MKILFVTPWYPSEFNANSGVFIEQHARAVALKHDVTILALVENENVKRPSVETTTRGGMRTVYAFYRRGDAICRHTSRIARIVRIFRLCRVSLNLLIARLGPFDIVHANIGFPTGFFFLFCPALRKAPAVYTEHWSRLLQEVGNRPAFLERISTQALASRAAAITTVSDFLRRNMRATGIRGSYFIVPNVIDTALFLPGVLPHRRDRVIGLMVGGLHDEVKRFSAVIAAIPRILKGIPTFTLRIVGAGPDGAMLKRLAVRAGTADRVEFLGMIEHDRVPVVITSSDFLILNSAYETFSVASLEAISCGIPVVAARCGGVEEFIIAENGILFEKDDEDALVEAVIHMAGRLQSFDRQRMHDFVERRYSQAAIAESFSAVYRHVQEARE